MHCYALSGKRADSAVYISISMVTKSGKTKSKSRYTDVHTILEEIDQESETDCWRTIHLASIALILKLRNIICDFYFILEAIYKHVMS